MSKLMDREKEKKRLTVAFVSGMTGIRKGFEELIGNLRKEINSLQGNLSENRRCFTEMANGMGKLDDKVSEDIVAKILAKLGEKESATKDKEVFEEVRKEAIRVENQDSEPEDRRKKSKKRKKKKNTMPEEAKRKEVISYSQAVGNGSKRDKEVIADIAIANKEGGTFQEVRSRKVKGSEKIDKSKDNWRAKEPAKTFVVEVGKEGKENARKVLWAEMVRKVRAPRVAGVAVLARGDLRVTPGDADTLVALRSMEKEGKVKLREVGQNLPKVLIYDVDQVMEAGEIGRAMRNQNEDTGLEEGREELDFKPLFKKGPKGGEKTWWVCEVCPNVYRKIVNRRMFVGLSSCKVVEFVDVYQCKGCLGFGHMEAKCVRKRVICSHCAKEGHRSSECNAKDRAPK